MFCPAGTVRGFGVLQVGSMHWEKNIIKMSRFVWLGDDGRKRDKKLRADSKIRLKQIFARQMISEDFPPNIRKNIYLVIDGQM
jgi:hypothetical protein